MEKGGAVGGQSEQDRVEQGVGRVPGTGWSRGVGRVHRTGWSRGVGRVLRTGWIRGLAECTGQGGAGGWAV